MTVVPVVSLEYRFRQPFRQSAQTAFAWCTDFGPTDGPLFSTPVKRSVRWINEHALVMTDTKRTGEGMSRISRLVRIFPEELAWTNTHLTGPYRNSQFWYRVVPDGPRRSHLDFVGLALRTTSKPPTAFQHHQMAEELRVNDSTEWRTHLAPALERDLGR